jgi:glycine cleavage system H protein
VDALYPADLRYTAEHEWVQQLFAETGARFRIGITDFAQDALGDIVYVDLPAVGDQVTSGDPCGELESTKSVSELYAPITGTVVARNEALSDTPEVVNADPYGEGWLLDIEADTDEEAESLLDAETYQGIVDQQ